jgi:MFS family permease
VRPEHPIEEDGQLVADDDHSKTWRGRLAIWKDPRTLLIGVLVLAAAFAEGSANDWLAIASVDGHGVANATGAVIFGIFVTAMTVGRLTGVFLLDRFGRVPVLRASFLLASIGLLVFIFVPNVPVAIAGAVLWGLGSALGFPIGMSAAADDPKTAAARVSAVATIGYFAFLVGPPVIGLLGEHVGVIHALLVTLVLAGIGALVAGAAREPARAPAAPIDNFDDPQL